MKEHSHANLQVDIVAKSVTTIMCASNANMELDAVQSIAHLVQTILPALLVKMVLKNNKV